MWKEKDGLPWRVVTGIEVDPKTGDVWLGLFGGGLARFSGGRFDHFHQLNSGLVNDVVYAIAMENENVWAATTAGSSRYNTKTKEWAIFTEKNAPMEEIWNYNVAYNKATDKVHLAVWGSGVLEFDCKKDREQKGDPWKVYLDPDGEMEIDLYRDDGIIHVITTGVSPVDDVFWVSSYFGCCRYDGRHWRGFYAHETGLPSDFTNNVRARSVNECWFAHDKGTGVVADFPTETVVSYTRDPQTLRGKAQIYRSGKLLKTRRHARGRAAEFRHLHRPRRERHLGRDRQRPGLGDRRRLLCRPEVEPGLARGGGESRELIIATESSYSGVLPCHTDSPCSSVVVLTAALALRGGPAGRRTGQVRRSGGRRPGRRRHPEGARRNQLAESPTSVPSCRSNSKTATPTPRTT